MGMMLKCPHCGMTHNYVEFDDKTLCVFCGKYFDTVQARQFALADWG